MAFRNGTLTRRDFAQLGLKAAAAGAAASAMPRAFGAPSGVAGGKKIGYAIVGLGRISVDHFMPGILASDNSRVAALVSGHPDKAKRIATQYGLPDSAIYSYENYNNMRDNPSIDAVYIGLPNGMHAEYTVRAAQAGKHVLCEKPMATTVADSRAMIFACAEASKKLMIAYRLQLEPTNLRAIQIIRSGTLGKIQAIESAHGFNIAKGEWRLDRKLGGGGPMMDVGIYSLNACRYLTGEEPAQIVAFSSVIDKDGRFDQVEENISWTMRFPSGIVAACNSTYGAEMNGYYRVHGSNGTLHLETAFPYQGQHLTAHMWGINGQPERNLDELSPEKDPAHFARMATHFSNCILNNQTPVAPGEEGLKDMELMSGIYKSAGLAAL